MKLQKGQALILVLILLAVGALLIIPVLGFTFTGLHSQRLSEDALTKQAAADSALEDALWQMLNGGLLSTLNPDDPEYTYDFEFGLDRFKVNIEVPSVPESEWYKYRQVEVKVEVQPDWLEGQYDETPVFQYVIRISMPQWDLTNFGLSLPQGLTYIDYSALHIGPEKALDKDAPVEGSTIWMNDQWVEMIAGAYEEVYEWPPSGGVVPDTAYLLITTEPDGRQTLEWMPIFVEHGRQTLVHAYQVTGTPPWGINYVEPWLAGNFGSFDTGQTGGLGVAIYNILIDVEGVTYQVVVAYDSTTGEFKIISYQIVE